MSCAFRDEKMIEVDDTEDSDWKLAKKFDTEKTGLVVNWKAVILASARQLQS